MANDPQVPQDPKENQPTDASGKSPQPAFGSGTGPSEGTGASSVPGYDRVEEAGTFQMLWDCKYCGTKKLLGVTHKFCPSCGAAQDAGARYFPSDEEAIAVEDHEYTGADTKCKNCGTANAAKAEFCTQCGSPTKDAVGVALRTEQVSAGAFGADSAKDAKADFQQQKTGMPATPAEAPKSNKMWYYIGGGVGVGLIALIASFFYTKTIEVKIDSHNWEKTVRIESFKGRSDTAWCDTMPYDAYMVMRKREVRSTNKVADGETCTMARVDKGNGTFRKERRCNTKYKDVPVYADKCYYRVNRWGHERDIRSAGGLAQTPQWPTVQIRAGSCVGCEREAGRSESYTLNMSEVKKPAKKHACGYPEAKWRAIPDGAVKKIKVRLIGGAKCDTLG
jgi:hypothetical protein